MTNYLGSFIKQKRGNMSLREFANLIGISHSHLDSIEKGYDPKTGKPVNISLEVLNKLAKVLDVEDLLLIYLAKTDYKEVPNLFDSLIQFQNDYKTFVQKYNFDKTSEQINFSSEKCKNEWKKLKEETNSELDKIGKNELMILLFKNLSIEDITTLIKNNCGSEKINDKYFSDILHQIFDSNKNSKKPMRDELDVLFDKHKDILTDDDKETIKFIIEKRKREIDKELNEE